MNSFGRYELIEPLGEGSMGVIYKAKDQVLDRYVALKTLSAIGANDPELLERFCREARACARLRHPNIVTVYDFGQEKDAAYIAMELLEGSDLRQLLAAKVAMPLDRKLRTMAAVCEGLHHAHCLGIVHRDIKPSNIFVDSSGRPYILDFGVAHIPTSSLTIAGRVLGTPQYMSPEQMLGQNTDARSDIYSATIVAFELLAGQNPLQGPAINRITQDIPASLLAYAPDLPVELDALLRKGLSRDPRERFSSAAELAGALQQAALKASAVGKPRKQPAYVEAFDTATPVRLAGGTETILSAVLGNLQKFDDAVDRGDLNVARHAMAEMRRAGAEDSRYAIALKQSAERLSQLERDAAPANIAASPLASAMRECPPPIPAMTALDATVFSSNLTKPPAPVAAPRNDLAAISSPLWPSLIVKAEPAPPPGIVLPATRRKGPGKWIAITTVLVGVLGCGAFVWQNHADSGHSDPIGAVATAQVMVAQAPLFASPYSGEAAVATVHKGDKLDVLRAPRSQDQQWTEVRWYSEGHWTPAVFAPTIDLGNWSSSDAKLAAELRQMFAQTPPPSER